MKALAAISIAPWVVPCATLGVAQGQVQALGVLPGAVSVEGCCSQRCDTTEHDTLQAGEMRRVRSDRWRSPLLGQEKGDATSLICQ